MWRTRNELQIFLILMCVLFPFPIHAQHVWARAVAEHRDVFVGESFIFQIQIEGTDQLKRPDLSNIKDFKIDFLGGQTNNQQTIQIINGRMTKEEKKGYVFSYRFTPFHPGNFTIPAIRIFLSKGYWVQTQPLTIHVKKPRETKDFKLRISLSKTKCYIGEPVILTVTWYIGKDVRDFSFFVPVLKDDRFYHDNVDVVQDPTKKYYAIPIEGEKIVAEKGTGELDGQEYVTLTFQKVLIPKQIGEIEIEKSMVVCEALIGYRRRNSDFFSDFFEDDFFSSPFTRQGVYKKFVIPSNSLSLKVIPLPNKGKPKGFQGYIGKYHIETTAIPTKVKVGDPITLTIKISGPSYLKHIKLPPLQEQSALSKNFKIPKEMAPGKIQGKAKVFTQTIRAIHPNVKEIPPIELVYFNPNSGKYEVTRSKPIPLKVSPTKVVTALDAEGRDSSLPKNELEAFAEGIAYNYEDMSVLQNQNYGLLTLIKDPIWMIATFSPLAIYLILAAIVMTVRKAKADPLAQHARQAYKIFRKKLAALNKSKIDSMSLCSDLLGILREYLGNKLQIPSKGLTYPDVEKLLIAKTVSSQTLKSLKKLFQECEAGCYAGKATLSDEWMKLPQKAMEIVKELEKGLKK